MDMLLFPLMLYERPDAFRRGKNFYLVIEIYMELGWKAQLFFISVSSVNLESLDFGLLLRKNLKMSLWGRL